MGLITLFKLICFLLFIIAMVLSLYETIKVFMYFNKETKKRKIPREEYFLKAKKMGLYYLAFIIASFFYGFSSAF
ncbi:hypothetical protein QWY14_04090 [Planococcus sp. N028]|uniref:Uncharacterized protein n=1 Tax=Planococcus shixiaomingii TaxID=3058393 RepID=A0ABT8MZB7_9BACL|nr:hypothetical protein [Planococcus sp. N028]MDN7240954.1 hypothetical protein [Planococcus sp. N028]